MFPFRKKTKPLPKTIIRRKRTAFVKKSTASRETPSAKQETESKKQWDIFLVVYVFLWLVFFGVAGYLLIFSSFLRLNTVHIEGLTDIPEQSVSQFIVSDMSERYLSGMPKNNLITFPLKKVEADIMDRFKKIQSVEITREFPHTLNVHIQERKTLVLWCANESCFYIDEHGYAYSPVDTDQPQSNLGNFLKIIDTSGQSVDMDEPLFDEDFVHFAADIQEQLQQRVGIEVESECSTPSRFADELALKTKEGWMIYVNVRLPMEKSLQTLQLLLKREINEDRRHRLKYIDLRTENRAYFSVEGETISAPESETVDGQATPSPDVPAEEVENEAKKDKKKNK